MNGTGRRSSVHQAPASLAAIKDITPEELAQYEHGIQVIDENKDFT